MILQIFSWYFVHRPLISYISLTLSLQTDSNLVFILLLKLTSFKNSSMVPSKKNPLQKDGFHTRKKKGEVKEIKSKKSSKFHKYLYFISDILFQHSLQ